MRYARRIWIFLSLLVFSCDKPQAQQVSICSLLSKEKKIRETHRRIEKVMISNMILIQDYPDSLVEIELKDFNTNYDDPFKSTTLHRPSALLVENLPCFEQFVEKKILDEYRQLHIQTQNALRKALAINQLIRSKIPKSSHEYFISKNGGFRLFNLRYSGYSYKCIELNPRDPSIELQFIYKNKKNRGHDFKEFTKSSESILALFNAGIFNKNYEPEGLLVANGKLEKELNNSIDSFGNFYLQPNGVFYINKDSSAHVRSREIFTNLDGENDFLHATQSGPMLVIDGKIHPRFNPQSKNKFIRNGVGVNKKGHIVFIFTEHPVNLYSFASIFRDEFGCFNALYLDGAISHLYSPFLPDQNLPRRRFGPLISISINSD